MQAAGGISRFGGLAIALGVGTAVATGAVGVCGIAAAAPADDPSSTAHSAVGTPSAGSRRATPRDGAARGADAKPALRQRRNDVPRASAVAPTVDKPVPAAALPAAAPVAGTVQAVSGPVTSTGPGSPAESPAGWLLVAAVRRTGRPEPPPPAAATVSTGQPLGAAKGSSFAARFSNRTPTMAPAQTSQGLTGQISGNLNAADADGDGVTYTVDAKPAHGTVTLDSTGDFLYTPDKASAHTGVTDDFTVTVTDAGAGFHIHGFAGLLSLVSNGRLGNPGHTATRTVTVTVSPVNADPTAVPSADAPDPTTGVVKGRIAAADSDGDPLSYNVSQAGAKGTVTLAADGSFTYTPTDLARHVASLTNVDQAATTDSFTVTVADGSGGTVEVPVGVVVSPASITFDFVYGTGSQYWSQPARAALQSAATRLASFVVVSRPVTVSYDVVGESNGRTNLLANAFVPFGSGSPGYYGTVVQTKVLTGVDANGASTDGQLSFDFAFPWALGDTVANNQYDFQSVAMHELVHSFGVITGLGDPSSIDRNWTTFDGFLATADGVSPIGADYVWNNADTPNLTGGNGGLYFAGPDAEAAYGGPVPLYTPGIWGSGASLTHLDPARAPAGTTYLMDPFEGYGPGVRVLTPVEAGMLADLGYTLYQGPVYAVFFVGLRLRRRRPEKAGTLRRLS